MTIQELAQKHAFIEKIDGVSCEGKNAYNHLVFWFEGNHCLHLSVNAEEDSLVWGDSSELKQVTEKYEEVKFSKSYGRKLFLAWSWEMVNQQGFFDALQLQFLDDTFEVCVIVQFKSTASVIEIFEVIHRKS